jgi:hypothetical protein
MILARMAKDVKDGIYGLYGQEQVVARVPISEDVKKVLIVPLDDPD